MQAKQRAKKHDGPPMPPAPPGTIPGPPGPPVVTLNLLNGISVFAEQSPGSRFYRVSFNYALSVALSSNLADVGTQTVEALLIADALTAEAVQDLKHEARVISKRSSVRDSLSVRITDSGSLMVSTSQFESEANRRWTLAIRVRSNDSQRRVITIATISVPVVGLVPTRVDVFVPR